MCCNPAGVFAHVHAWGGCSPRAGASPEQQGARPGSAGRPSPPGWLSPPGRGLPALTERPAPGPAPDQPPAALEPHTAALHSALGGSSLRKGFWSFLPHDTGCADLRSPAHGEGSRPCSWRPCGTSGRLRPPLGLVLRPRGGCGPQAAHPPPAAGRPRGGEQGGRQVCSAGLLRRLRLLVPVLYPPHSPGAPPPPTAAAQVQGGATAPGRPVTIWQPSAGAYGPPSPSSHHHPQPTATARWSASVPRPEQQRAALNGSPRCQHGGAVPPHLSETHFLFLDPHPPACARMCCWMGSHGHRPLLGPGRVLS